MEQHISANLTRVIPETDPLAKSGQMSNDSQMAQTLIFVSLSGFAMSMVYYVFNLIYD